MRLYKNCAESVQELAIFRNALFLGAAVPFRFSYRKLGALRQAGMVQVKEQSSDLVTNRAEKKRILLVDDHLGARQRLTEVLRRAFEAPELHPVSTLAEARQQFANYSFDIIVLDLSLPDGAGDTFLEEIMSRDPNAYVVIATIHDESEHLIRALENGAKGYLLKEQSIEEQRERKLARPRPPP